MLLFKVTKSVDPSRLPLSFNGPSSEKISLIMARANWEDSNQTAQLRSLIRVLPVRNNNQHHRIVKYEDFDQMPDRTK